VLLKQDYTGGPYWRGFDEFLTIPQDAKVEPEIMEVDGPVYSFI
jgi:hypothetical protein